MAQQRQSRTERHDMHRTNGTVDHVAIGMRAPVHTHKYKRLRRSARSNKAHSYAVRAILVFLCLVFLVAVLAYYYISTKGKETNNHSDNDETGDLRSDSDFLTNESWIGRARVLEFGKGSVGGGQDSRYWDEDDRRRDEDYNEDVMEQTSGGLKNENVDKDDADIDDDYDDFFYFHDAHVEEHDDSRNIEGGHSNFVLKSNDIVHKASLNSFDAEIKDDIVAENVEMVSSLNKTPSQVVK